MAINVYWSCLEKEWQRSLPPLDIYKNFCKTLDPSEAGLVYCPAFRKELINTYGLRSLYDFEFTVEDDTIKSGYYDQSFFDWHVLVRSFQERIFSFSQEFVFFTDAETLPMTANFLPFLEDNSITERCLPIPGNYDIAKWFRPVEFSFILKKQFDTFKISQEEIYQYVKFHTDEKINFCQFYYSDKIKEFIKCGTDSRENRKKVSVLDYWYEKFKLKKLILKEIKVNIL